MLHLSVGDLELGVFEIPVTGGTAYLTPYHLVSYARSIDDDTENDDVEFRQLVDVVLDNEVADMVRLMLLLDNDDNPDNGILITDAVKEALNAWLVDGNELPFGKDGEGGFDWHYDNLLNEGNLLNYLLNFADRDVWNGGATSRFWAKIHLANTTKMYSDGWIYRNL